ncbi:MAG: hypothetical protein C3F06_09220 [Candidatus Methanoperedenaceae archaeon]|nr:MAG: hypothetical protein C3F06_09220 [Candidatus Methanoperedenaceae archaeon]
MPFIRIVEKRVEKKIVLREGKMKECRLKKIHIHIFLFVFAIFIFNILPVNSMAADQKTSIDVRSMMLANENVPIIIILKEKAQSLSKENMVSELKSRSFSSQNDIGKLLEEEKTRGKADKIKQFWIVNAIAVNASPELIRTLSMRDDIESIGLDSKMHMLENYSALVTGGQIASATDEIKGINATKVWELGIDGSGINVSVIDTGINASHPDISGRVIKWMDYINDNLSGYDDNGHGTHVAGTVGGNGSGGTTTGVAPNVNLFGAKVLNSTGDGFTTDIISAIQWSVENKADIISLSLGGGRDTALKDAINNAVSAGVTVIAAAGNYGPGVETISYPAGEKNVIAVGAVDGSDTIAWFSSIGPVTVDSEVLTKPDISAPGVDIISLNYLSNYYMYESGTSMATPHVSGAAALILQAARKQGTTLTPAQIKSILEDTSIDLGTAGKDNTYGSGRIDVYAAVFSLDIVAPSVYPGGSITVRNGTKITINATITDSNKGVKNASVNVSVLNDSINTILLNNLAGFWVNNSVVVNANEGLYYLNITAYDNAGNVNNTENFTVIVDNSKPDVMASQVLYRHGNAARTGSLLEFNATAIDPEMNGVLSGIKNASVNVSSINNTGIIALLNNSGFWKGNVTIDKSAPDGNYFLNLTFFDLAGNFNDSVQINVSMDNTPPSVSAISLNSKLDVRGFTNITANISDNFDLNNSDIHLSVKYPNGSSTAYAMSNGGSNLFYRNFSDTEQYGRYNVTITANDTTGNSNNSEKTWFVTINTHSSTVSTRGSGNGETANGIFIWNRTNFPGLILNESLNVKDVTPGRVIENGKLRYNTSKVEVNFKVYENEGKNISGNQTYFVMGLQGEKYVAINGKANKLANLVLEMNGEDKKTLKTGETWALGAGYELTINAIDAGTSPKQVWFTIRKDGVLIDDGIASEKSVYDKTNTIQGESNALMFTVYIDSIFSGSASDNVQFKYAWLMDQNSSREIQASEKLGIFEVTSANSGMIEYSNVENVTLLQDIRINLADYLYFRTSNNVSLEYYPFFSYITPTKINGSRMNGTELEIMTDQSIEGSVNITSMADIPPEMNRTLSLTPLSKYIEINATQDLNNSITSGWMILKLYYTASELNGLDENTLKISWYNESLKSWEILSSGSPAWVHATGVAPADINGFAGYAWANISHLSTFGMVGSYPVSATTVPSSGGGGGGGGGGGKSAENSTNIEVIEKYDIEILKDVLTPIRFKDTKNPIMFVNITGNKSLGVITASIEVLKDTSTIVKVPPEGLVYKNANIWVGTSGMAVPKNIREALIRFKVDNSWMSTNGVLANDIILMKWDGSSWSQLETQVSSRDDTNTYFVGTTNSFSPFAITGVKSSVTSTQVTIPAGTSTPQKVIETTPRETSTPGFNIVLAFAAISGLYLLGRKRR